MKKNNKGFFLAETIVVIALVTTIMAFVYPNITKLYDNYKNKAEYYDQVEDLYVLKSYYDWFTELGEIDDITSNGERYIDKLDELYIEKLKDVIKDGDIRFGGVEELYIISYMSTPSSNNYNFNKYLHRLKKTTYDCTSYRLIGQFNKDGVTRYASIKVDNPNPVRSDNLGGQCE